MGTEHLRSSGHERAPSPDPKGMRILRREERHATVVTVLTHYVPWVTLAGSVGFFAWWVVSLATGFSDAAALTMFIVLTVFAGFSWLTRYALLGPEREPDPKP